MNAITIHLGSNISEEFKQCAEQVLGKSIDDFIKELPINENDKAEELLYALQRIEHTFAGSDSEFYQGAAEILAKQDIKPLLLQREGLSQKTGVLVYAV